VEEREANKGRHRSWDLQYALLHEVRTWCTQMHVASRDEGRVKRGIVAIACLIDLRLRDGHHASLTIASHRDSCKGLESVLRLLQVGRLKGPVVVTMRSELMPLREDTLDDLGSVLSEVRRTEKSSTYLMLLQYIEEGM